MLHDSRWLEELCTRQTHPDQGMSKGKGTARPQRLHLSVESERAKSSHTRFFLPPDMAIHQPESLHYLHKLASRHGFGLIEDRREIDIQPLTEQRVPATDCLAGEIVRVVQLTGHPKAKLRPRQSATEHPDHVPEPLGNLSLLMQLGVRVRHSGRSVTLPSDTALHRLCTSEDPHIHVQAARVDHPDAPLTVGVVQAGGFRAVVAQQAGVMAFHMLHGGGLIRDPQLWSRVGLLGQCAMRFQLHVGASPEQSMGMLYSTWHIDTQAASATGTGMADARAA